MVGQKWDNRDLYDLVIPASITFSSYEWGMKIILIQVCN
jgi:hypothetical protein